MNLNNPFLSVIVPVFNEEKTLKKVFEKVKKAKPKNKEIIFVDDCSTDNSLKILKQFEKEKNVQIFKHSKNQGKGTAIKTGLKHTTGKITIIQDADLEYNPEEYVTLIKPILKKETKVVYGSRFLNQKQKKTKFYYANKLLSFLTSIIYFKRITDIETCYKIIKTDIFKELRIESKGFDLDPEITSKLLKKGYNIKEIPISYFPRTRKEGKKIKLKDGIIAVYTLIKWKLRKIN